MQKVHVPVDDTTTLSFYSHHAAAVSAAVAFAESTVLRDNACALADELTVLHPPRHRPAHTSARRPVSTRRAEHGT